MIIEPLVYMLIGYVNIDENPRVSFPTPSPRQLMMNSVVRQRTRTMFNILGVGWLMYCIPIYLSLPGLIAQPDGREVFLIWLYRCRIDVGIYIKHTVTYRYA